MGASTNQNCPLCWDNNRLKGGKVVGETEQLYAYAFSDEKGDLKYALINPKDHHADMRTLRHAWGKEFAQLYVSVLSLMPEDQPHNGYWNQGEVAGQRVLGHWHVRIEPRFPDRPSSGMGPALLVEKVDELSV